MIQKFCDENEITAMEIGAFNFKDGDDNGMYVVAPEHILKDVLIPFLKMMGIDNYEYAERLLAWPKEEFEQYKKYHTIVFDCRGVDLGLLHRG